MGRPKNAVPSNCHHKPTDTARAWVGGRWVTLGRYNSPDSRAEYARVVAEAAVGGMPATADTPTINEVLLAYLRHAEGNYRRADGTPTNEVVELKATLRPVRELYGHTVASEFGPLAMKAVQGRMVELGWCRTQVNRRVGRVKRAFKWAASEQLIPASVYHGLQTVAGLQPGRTAAKESAPVLPVDPDTVTATIPHLTRHVAGLVRFQMLTGCRPGEACVLRREDIDMSGPIWLFRPPHHKNSWRGKSRTIALGPKAQELIRACFTPDLGDYLFSPARAVEEFHAERGANRKTPRYTSHMTRNANKRNASPERAPADKYNPDSYGKCVDRGCDRAFPPPAPLARREDETKAGWWKRLTEEQKRQVQAWQKARRWQPNRLRHTHATEVRKRFGLEAAQVALGHARDDITRLYAERDGQLAEQVASEIG